MENLTLNVALLRKRVPNLTVAAKEKGLRPATVSNLCTGKTPVGRAELRTIVALAELAECKIDDLIIRGHEMKMIETGIKIVDFFSPITRGGINGFIARSGMGQLVLLAEILYRLKKENYTTMLFMPDTSSPELKEVIESSDILIRNLTSAFEAIPNLNGNVILAADKSLVATGEIYSLLDKLNAIDGLSTTTFLVDPTGEAVDEELPYGPLDSHIVFDTELISRKLFPAINPISSTSMITENNENDKKHMELLQKARKILRRYRELRFLVNAFGFDRLQFADKEIYKRGERLEAYLTQRFFVAEPYTKKKGASISLGVVLDDVNRIIDGQVDELSSEKLLYIGSLNEVM
ncbi:ATP synthase beta subunit C-terminal domain-containing protein [Ornithinibacillus halotolerans]|uniref:ATP synthase A/B type C-terminal domain-containing protein n=1 Tax=Ornithinibacillus halotolerans TaxID=1274357 RepID=A0A916RU83_9BACI|nr:hypothetical protein [Ornithinibacillus halotolerans]GGA67814.1 hypothetical protein GCM10008025_09590 [Ornithinibacillus halotolerans]